MTKQKPLTKAQASARLAKVEAEYRRVSSSIDAQPEGNGFATQQEMREEAVRVYVSTIISLRRQAGVY